MIIGEANVVWTIAALSPQFSAVCRGLKSADIEPRDTSTFFISITRALALIWCR
jgi:hypothetical protein